MPPPGSNIRVCILQCSTDQAEGAMSRTTTLISDTFALLLLAAPAWAEVLDKEPSGADLWLTAAVVGAAGLVAWLWKARAGVVFSVVGLAWVWSFHWELVEPWVGP